MSLTKLKVTCATRKSINSNGGKYHVIAGLGGPWEDRYWRYTAEEVIDDIESGYVDYVVDNGVDPVTEIRVVESGGKKFLESHLDGVRTNNLSELPDCP